MDKEYLLNSWGNLLARHSVLAEHSKRIFDQLYSAYSEPQRYYHTLNHIQDMVQKFDQLSQGTNIDDSLYFATWYHDVVYSVHRKHMANNERNSANMAESDMALMGLPQQLIDQTVKMIIASKAHQLTDCESTNIFLDCDMSILGAAPGHYRGYADAVRQEHKSVPWILFKYYRRKFLKSVLGQNTIFLTPYFNEKFEMQARDNIQWELKGFK